MTSFTRVERVGEDDTRICYEETASVEFKLNEAVGMRWSSIDSVACAARACKIK